MIEKLKRLKEFLQHKDTCDEVQKRKHRLDIIRCTCGLNALIAELEEKPVKICGCGKLYAYPETSCPDCQKQEEKENDIKFVKDIASCNAGELTNFSGEAVKRLTECREHGRFIQGVINKKHNGGHIICAKCGRRLTRYKLLLTKTSKRVLYLYVTERNKKGDK